MKIQKHVFFLFKMAVALLLLAGCAAPVPTILPQPSATPSAPPSHVPNSKLTSVPSPTVSSEVRCHTPICMSSVPGPTLISAVQERFFELLKNNGDCELPCFLGITPGKTSWPDANSILQPFAVNKPIDYDKTRSTSTNRTYSATIQTEASQESPARIDMYIALDVDQNNLVQHIVMSAEIHGNGSTEFSDKHLSRYGLRDVFLRNGSPDIIYYPPEMGGYGFDVVYEKLKMVIDFTGSTKQSINGGYTLCPNIGDGQVSSMRIALANPSDPIDVKTLIGYPFDSNPTLEKVVGLSLSDFYGLMISDQQPACFQVK